MFGASGWKPSIACRSEKIDPAAQPCGTLAPMILDRKVRIVPLRAGIEFRHLIHGEIARSPRDRFCDPAGLIVKAVTFHALRDEPVVVRPDRAGLVIEGVEALVIGRERPDAPAAPHVRLHQPIGDPPGPIRRHDARPETLPRIGCDGQDRPLLAVEGVSVEPFGLVPERLVELLE